MLSTLVSVSPGVPGGTFGGIAAPDGGTTVRAITVGKVMWEGDPFKRILLYAYPVSETTLLRAR